MDGDADIDELVETLDAVGADSGATVQAFDARYVAGRAHLRRAVELADRERERGNGIARDRGIEMLLYAAGCRQIDRALSIGIEAGEPMVALVDGGDEASAAAAVRRVDGVQPADLELGDPDCIRAFFDISDEELDVVDGDLGALVRERVALLVVDR